MTLNREDYPDMTDEQWDALNAEFDRVRTQASETARKNTEKKLKEDRQREIDEAVEAAREEERATLEASESERLEMERKKIEDERNTFNQERRTFSARSKLIDGGIPTEKADELVGMFATVDDKQFDGVLDNFIKTYSEAVDAKVDAEKQTLLDNATPPNDQTGGTPSNNKAAEELLAAGDVEGAADALLTDAGYSPQK